MKRMMVILVISLLPSISAYPQERLEMLLISKQYDKALQLIEKELSRRSDMQLMFIKAQIHASMNHYQKAIAIFSECLSDHPRNALIHSEMADAYNALGNSSDAVFHLRNAVKHDPGNIGYQSKLGQLLISQREFGEAYRIFRQIRETDSVNVFFSRQMAIAAARSGQPDEAIALFEQVLGENPRDMVSYLQLCGLYQQNERYALAGQVLNRGLEQFPGNPLLLLRLAQNHYNQRDFAGALPLYEAWIAGNKPDFDTWKEYGITLYFNKQEERALEILEQAMNEVVNDPIVALYIGLCHKKLKNYETSRDYLNHAIECATPHYLSSIYHHLGQVYGQMRDFATSIEMLKTAQEYDPENFELLFEIATTYEEYNANKTLALNYYNLYLTGAKEKALNAGYALDRIRRIREDLFFEK